MTSAPLAEEKRHEGLECRLAGVIGSARFDSLGLGGANSISPANVQMGRSTRHHPRHPPTLGPAEILNQSPFCNDFRLQAAVYKYQATALFITACHPSVVRRNEIQDSASRAEPRVKMKLRFACVRLSRTEQESLMMFMLGTPKSQRDPIGCRPICEILCPSSSL